MKRISLLILFFNLLLSHAVAQNPSWAKKAANAVFTLKTFSKDGQLLASSNGFFVSAQGEAVSCYMPFKGAQRAVIIDAQGKEWPVECIIGANDMYDVAKFKVDIKKPQVLTIATTKAEQDATAWLMPYAAKKVPVCKRGTVSKAEVFQNDYAYYTLDMQSNELQTGCPILNEQGEAIGILQPAADTKAQQSYAVSALFASTIQMSGLGMNAAAMKATGIKKALPDDIEQAQVALFMGASALDSLEYANFLERFIQKFPQSPDGYIYRARTLASSLKFAEAENDMNTALKVADKKDDVHYQYANLIYQHYLLQANAPYEPWTLDRALQESKDAYAITPMPVYLQQQAQLLYTQQRYEEAFQLYQQLAQSDMRSADIFYAAAQCRLALKDQEGAIAQLDSAVNTFTKPYLRAAAPYLIARGRLLDAAGKYRLAVSDYNEYEKLMPGQLTADFYYLREQAEYAGHLYQQAIDDIRKAVDMAPQDPVYQIEKTSVELRLGLTDEAIVSAREAVRLAPDDADGHLLLGIGLCVKGQKKEGLESLQKAKELGHEQAQSLIEKYSK